MNTSILKLTNTTSTTFTVGVSTYKSEHLYSSGEYLINKNAYAPSFSPLFIYLFIY